MDDSFTIPKATMAFRKSPYSLPAATFKLGFDNSLRSNSHDEEEMDRLNMQHEALKLVIGRFNI